MKLALLVLGLPALALADAAHPHARIGEECLSRMRVLPVATSGHGVTRRASLDAALPTQADLEVLGPNGVVLVVATTRTASELPYRTLLAGKPLDELACLGDLGTDELRLACLYVVPISQLKGHGAVVVDFNGKRDFHVRDLPLFGRDDGPSTAGLAAKKPTLEALGPFLARELCYERLP